MARTTRAESEATAQRVLATARALFTQHGYAAVGLEQVAAGAGVTRGAVYHHFASKKGLFQAVLGAAQHSVAQAVERATAPVVDPWEQLEVGCREFLTASTADDARRVVLVDGPAVLGWDVWRERDAAGAGRLLVDALEGLHAAGRLDVGSVPAAAALLSGAMNEAALWISDQHDPVAATDLAWRSLRGMLASLRA